MNAKTSRLVAALCCTVMLSASVLSQSPDRRPRPTTSVRPPTIIYPRDIKSPDIVNVPRVATLESSIPRDELLFYFEIRKGALLEMAQSLNSLAPLLKAFSSQTKASQMDMAGFIMSQLGVLSNARIAAVSFGGKEMTAVIETASSTDAESLKAGLNRLFGNGQSTRALELEVRSSDRIVMAGNRAAVEKISQSGGAFSIGEDQQFMHARSRFADDPFFAYVDMGAMPMMIPPGVDAANQAAYAAGMMAGLGNMPQAVAVGGRIDGDQMTVRALMVFGPQQSGGLFGRMFSSEVAGENRAANFVSPNTDVFVDLRINWDGLLDGIGSMFESIASAAAASQGASEGGQQAGQAMAMPDLLQMIESSLGFSIRHDLIPTLGNEVAISISGFSRMLNTMAPGKRPASRPAMPNFMLIVELRDPATFEGLLARLFNPAGKPAAPLASESYRGSVVKWNKSVAYSITGGYLILSGSPGDIRRALDARQTGNSLASSAQFRAAVGSSGQSVMQGYVSAGVSSELFKGIARMVGKSNRDMAALLAASSETNSALGFSAVPDPDGFMMELRMPTNLVFLALASMSGETPPHAPKIIGGNTAVGIPQSTERRRGRKSPTLTTEDVKGRAAVSARRR